MLEILLFILCTCLRNIIGIKRIIEAVARSKEFNILKIHFEYNYAHSLIVYIVIIFILLLLLILL